MSVPDDKGMAFGLRTWNGFTKLFGYPRGLSPSQRSLKEKEKDFVCSSRVDFTRLSFPGARLGAPRGEIV